jgi:hypothetical protein
MASATVTFPAPDATPVEAYLARELAEGRPLGASVASSTVAARSVLFSGLAEGETYVAAGVVDGRTMSVRFVTDPPAPAMIAARLDALDAAVPLKADGSALDAHAALQTTAHGGITANNDTRLSNGRTPTAHHKIHEPGGTDPMAVDAAAATASLRTLGTGATQAAAGTDSRFPTSAEKAALVGTQGTPSGSNPLVTNVDARLFAISVKAPPYNAVDDGTTNDQAAIQAAITPRTAGRCTCRPARTGSTRRYG